MALGCANPGEVFEEDKQVGGGVKKQLIVAEIGNYSCYLQRIVMKSHMYNSCDIANEIAMFFRP